MKVSAVNCSGANFAGIQKLVYNTGGAEKTCLFSTSGKPLVSIKKIGEIIRRPNGDISGRRTFANGATISFETSRGSLYKEPYVPFEYHFPDGKNGFSRRLFVFDLEKFKENLEQLTSLKGIRKYIQEVDKAPKKTIYEPCC